MGFNKFISKIFGNKAQRDLKKINPYVNEIKETYPLIDKLTNDELRAKTKELENRINEYIGEDTAKVKELRSTISSIDMQDRESVWKEIDRKEEEIDTRIINNKISF